MSQVKSKKTVAERVAQFKVQNQEQMKIHRLKESVKKSQRRVHDDQYNEEVKKKQREKKRRQRAEKKNERRKQQSVLPRMVWMELLLNKCLLLH